MGKKRPILALRNYAMAPYGFKKIIFDNIWRHLLNNMQEIMVRGSRLAAQFPTVYHMQVQKCQTEIAAKCSSTKQELFWHFSKFVNGVPRVYNIFIYYLFIYLFIFYFIYFILNCSVHFSAFVANKDIYNICCCAATSNSNGYE